MAFSELDSFHAPMTRRDVVGLKYVIQGEENYVVNGKRHRVKPGQLLVVDELNTGEAFNHQMASKTIGLCINIDKALINQVISGIDPSSSKLEDPFHSNKAGFNFLLQTTPASQLALGKAVQELSRIISNQPDTPEFFDKDLFYSLSESLLQSNRETVALSSKVQASKIITQQEIYKRLLLAKEIMDECLDQKLDMNEVALQAGLSEYYFCRSFKSVFGTSPYKYLLNSRLNRGFKLVQSGKFSITEVAFSCGFSDIHSFSKAFKKHFSQSPSAFSKN